MQLHRISYAREGDQMIMDITEDSGYFLLEEVGDVRRRVNNHEEESQTNQEWSSSTECQIW
jgi:hypothetical protein